MLIKNPIERNISFEPIAHKYSDEVNSNYTSVTTLIESVSDEFDSDLWSTYKALEKLGFSPKINTTTRQICPRPEKNEFYTIERLLSNAKVSQAREDVLASWKDINETACDRGNKIHDYLEDCIKGYQETEGINTVSAVTRHDVDRTFYNKITNVEELEKSPLKYIHNEIYQRLYREIKDGWVIFAEKRVYLWEVLLCGTIDVLLVKGKEFKIIDWKTNKDKMHFQAGYYKKIKSFVDGAVVKIKTDEWITNGDKLKAPLNHLDNCKGVKYSLQVSLYAYMCEVWGMTCKGLEIYHIRPKSTYDAATDTDIVEEIVEHHIIDYYKNDIEILLQPRLELTKNK